MFDVFVGDEVSGMAELGEPLDKFLYGHSPDSSTAFRYTPLDGEIKFSHSNPQTAFVGLSS